MLLTLSLCWSTVVATAKSCVARGGERSERLTQSSALSHTPPVCRSSLLPNYPDTPRVELPANKPPILRIRLAPTLGPCHSVGMPAEPEQSTSRPRLQPNPHSEGRWKWWYSAISDWMLRNPDGSMLKCAQELGRNKNTIYSITCSDTFKRYHQLRKAEYQARHDDILHNKLHELASTSIDQLTAIVKKRGDQVPMQVLAPIAMGALDRLGFNPQQKQASAPSTAVNLTVDNRTVQLPGSVTQQDLEEARMALRTVEQRKLQSPLLDLEAIIPDQPDKEEAEPTRNSLVGGPSVANLGGERAPRDSD